MLRHTIEEAARMVAEEFGHFLVGREAAARRYRTLVRRLTEPASWRELREALEGGREKRPGKDGQHPAPKTGRCGIRSEGGMIATV